MSTHNICFRGEIRKILCGYPLLSVAMYTQIYSTVFITPDKTIFFFSIKIANIFLISQ